MKFILLGSLAFLGLVHANQQFDYHQFLSTFDLQTVTKFDNQRFQSVFLQKNQGSTNSDSSNLKSLDYEEFAKIFLQKTQSSQNFDYETFAKSLLKRTQRGQTQSSLSDQSQTTGNFDIQKFIDALKIQCGNNCRNSFDYEAFAKSLNLASLQDTDLKNFDSERFLDLFKVQHDDSNNISAQELNQNVGLAKDAAQFDHEGFAATFLTEKAEEKTIQQSEVKVQKDKIGEQEQRKQETEVKQEESEKKEEQVKQEESEKKEDSGNLRG